MHHCMYALFNRFVLATVRRSEDAFPMHAVVEPLTDDGDRGAGHPKRGLRMRVGLIANAWRDSGRPSRSLEMAPLGTSRNPDLGSKYKGMRTVAVLVGTFVMNVYSMSGW